jgi:hypothetical protein
MMLCRRISKGREDGCLTSQPEDYGGQTTAVIVAEFHRESQESGIRRVLNRSRPYVASFWLDHPKRRNVADL